MASLDETGLAELWSLVKGRDDLVKALANTKAKIETVSYVGTGTYGEGSQNTATFSFKPKLVFVEYWNTVTNEGGYTYNSAYGYNLLYAGRDVLLKQSLGVKAEPAFRKSVTLDGNTLTWCHGATDNSWKATDQYNGAGYFYQLVAIG